jgi:hypothetical protein
MGCIGLSGSFAFAQTIGVPAPAPDDNVTVCKKVDPPTGSHLPSPPICHTKAEWKQMESDGQNATQELQQIGTMHNMPGG